MKIIHIIVHVYEKLLFQKGEENKFGWLVMANWDKKVNVCSLHFNNEIMSLFQLS